MRPDIPWNVAGIPPEAREAARAAARREGLSVGEWMTRRILRSFSDAPDDMTPAREQWAASTGGYAPQAEQRPAATRRDTENMLAHVARSETESNDIYRRIEEQLRNVARRLESTERNQSENNRAMSKAASEINIAAREQAQAFDQLGGSVMGLADRLERVERSNANEGTREAIKGLHQGLTRLADQISTTANQSASQISTLASSMEALAGRLAQARAESQAATRGLDDRIAQLDQRVANISAIEERLRAVERNALATGEAISLALQTIEAHKDEEGVARRRETETAGAIARLEDNVAKLEARGTDPSIDRRLSGIERSLADIVGRLEVPAHNEAIEENIKRLTQRVEAAEARQREQVAELRAAVNDASARIATVETVPHSLTGGGQAAPFAQPPVAPFDTPPFPEAVPQDSQGFQGGVDPFAPAPAFAAEPPPFTADQAFGSGGGFPATDPFASPPPPVADSYLSAARRSARAAAAQAEAEHSGRIGGFSWGASASIGADDPANGKKTYIWIGVIVLLAILAIAAGAVLSQKITGAMPPSASALFAKSKPAKAETVPTQPANDLTPPTGSTPPTRPIATPLPAKANTLATAPAGTKPTEPKPTAIHAGPGTTAPVTAPAPAPAKPQAALTPLDRLTQLANAGNGKAELVVGLKYLDGDGVPVNEADAAKWLERAAEQGLPVAQYRLGTMYERGRGVPADAAKAVHWYQLAAQAGNRKAMHNLAVAYASGAGTAKNLAEAARWFSKAAALGLADSEFNLAVLYERGLGVPQSLLDAYKWYAIAAANGDAESRSRIDALATQLSSDDRAAAQHAADSFHAQALDARANVAPSLNDVTG